MADNSTQSLPYFKLISLSDIVSNCVGEPSQKIIAFCTKTRGWVGLATTHCWTQYLTLPGLTSLIPHSVFPESDVLAFVRNILSDIDYRYFFGATDQPVSRWISITFPDNASEEDKFSVLTVVLKKAIGDQLSEFEYGPSR